MFLSIGSFQGGRGRGRGRGGGPDPRSRLGTDDDGDFSMSDEPGQSSGSRYNPYDRKSNYQNKRGGRQFNNRSRGGADSRSSGGSGGYRNQYSGPSIPASEWYKVQFHYEGDKAVFFLKDSNAAESMGKFRNRFTLPNGMKMILIVKPSGPPYTIMDEDKIEKLKVCMSGRYDPPTKTLNLSSLYEDPGLLQDNLYLALNRNNIMSEVVKIIEENIPELEALDISNNRLMSLSTIGDLTKKAPNVVKLNIGKNSLHHIDEIDRLKGWKLEEIILDGNSLCDKFNDQSSYISAVRKKFPKVLKLDGHDLPPPIKFDIESSAELPETKGSFFQSSNLQELIVKFLKEYFTIYDSDNRQPLMEAYHESAVFSLSSAYNSVIEYT
ncbi:hypothetical protein KUTeg_014061 [Tegillarca granosa]|uniref:NTF2 domain-containing protein n=1 Tax=Tegillarca granosa TaxID=220873 RepID=A0ABQ9EVJ2_TEGGR|nr:hypothetical protein KUTeg_014061 [Tegillarca granosa]